MTTTRKEMELCDVCTRSADGGLLVEARCPVHGAGQPVDLVDLFDQLARTNAEGGEPVRVAAGTFAVYPAQGGGVVLVLNVTEGPEGLTGTMRKRLGPAMIRAMQAFGDGSGGLGAIKALIPKRGGRV
jgi:hypothetical protein